VSCNVGVRVGVRVGVDSLKQLACCLGPTTTATKETSRRTLSRRPTVTSSQPERCRSSNSEIDSSPVCVLDDVAVDFCYVPLNIHISSTMARLLEGKAAAITGGVTGTDHCYYTWSQVLLITFQRHRPRDCPRICPSGRQHWSQLLSRRQISLTIRKFGC